MYRPLGLREKVGSHYWPYPHRGGDRVHPGQRQLTLTGRHLRHGLQSRDGRPRRHL